MSLNINSFPASVFFFFKLPAIASIYYTFLCKFDRPQNIFCYEYMNIVYIKIKNQASAFKQTKKNVFMFYHHLNADRFHQKYEILDK